MNLTKFEILCKSHDLDQSDVLNDLVGRFLEENRPQTTLSSFRHDQDDGYGRIFDKASLFLTRTELERLLGLPDFRETDNESKPTFQALVLSALLASRRVMSFIRRHRSSIPLPDSYSRISA